MAVGQLKMSEQEALNTDINVIYLAEKSHWDMLKIIHGLKPEEKSTDGLSKEEALAELEERKHINDRWRS